MPPGRRGFTERRILFVGRHPSLARCPQVRVLALALGLFIRGEPTRAHDFWIEPSTFFPSANSVVALSLRVGVNWHGGPVQRAESRIRRFVVWSDQGERDIPGLEGADPAGYIRVAGPGLQIVAYESYSEPMDLSGEIFERHLKEEGLEALSELRAERNETDLPAKERFTRCAKTLLRVGEDASPAPSRDFGMPLEILAESSPFAFQPTGEFECRIRFRRCEPAGVMVRALLRGEEVPRESHRTDEQGRARFRLDRPGVWMIKCVHMPPVDVNAEWESYWATLTFEVLGESERPRPGG